MGLLSGEELTLIKGDIDSLRELTIEMVRRNDVDRDTTATALNMINNRLDYLESYINSIDKNIKRIEKLLGATYNETKKKHNS
jgi:hypothetical protein